MIDRLLGSAKRRNKLYHDNSRPHIYIYLAEFIWRRYKGKSTDV